MTPEQQHEELRKLSQHEMACAHKRTAEEIAQMYGALGLGIIALLNFEAGSSIGVTAALIGMFSGYSCWRAAVQGTTGWISAFTVLGIASAGVAMGSLIWAM